MQPLSRFMRRIETMLDTTMADLVDTMRHAAHPLVGAAQDYDPLLELIGDARLVLIGEASHGTHEFYRERAQPAVRQRHSPPASNRSSGARPRSALRCAPLH
jgi:hypothetical protein